MNLYIFLNTIFTTNFSVTGSQYTYGTKLRYHCSNGYHLVGTENFTCQADGTWDKDSIPKCEITSCGLPDPVQYAYFESEKNFILQTLVFLYYVISTFNILALL